MHHALLPRSNFRVAVLSGAISLLSSFTLSAQTATEWSVPRTPDGKPDLQGIWTNATQTPLERPVEFGTTGFLTEEQARQFEIEAQQRIERANRRAIPIDHRPATAIPMPGTTISGWIAAPMLR